MSVTSGSVTVAATPLQEALWWVHQRARNRSVYNLTWRMSLAGPLDRAALAQAWQVVVDRYSALRTSFELRDDAVVQTVHDRLSAPIEEVTVDDTGEVPAPTLLRLLAEELHERPVPLDRAPLGRLSSVRVGDREELLITLHHVAVDGWAMQLIMADLAAAYQAIVRGERPAAEREEISFQSYAERIDARRRAGDWQQGLDYWRKQLDGAVGTTVVADRPSAAGTGVAGATLRYAFSPDAVDGVTALATAMFATPFVVLFAALQIVLRRGGAGDDLGTGVIVANRMTPQDQKVVGYVANLMIARTRIDEGATIRQVVERVRDTMWGSIAHQDVPFPIVYGSLDEHTRNRLGTIPPIVATFHGVIGADVSVDGSPATVLESPSRTARTDMGIGIFAAADNFVAEVEYDSGRYDAETVLRLLRDIDETLVAGGADPDCPVASLTVRTRAIDRDVERRTPARAPLVPAPGLGVDDATSALVARVWQQVLGSPAVAPDDDFFAVGGRSLKVLELAALLRAETGREFDVVGWLPSPTPAHLAARLRGQPEAPGTAPSNTLLTVRAGEGGPHVHLVPGAGGGINDYQELVAALPGSWRVTQSVERGGRDTIEELARRFRTDLEDAGARPDLLVGWSMGGVVAYEMAARWTGPAPRLALLDSPPPVGYSQSVVDQDDFDLFAATVCADSDLGVQVGDLRVQPRDDELGARVLAAYLAAGGAAIPAEVLRTRWETYRRHRRMTGAYVAGHRLNVPALVVAAELTEQQLGQWDERFGAAPRRLRAANDHFGVLRAPGVAGVATAIEDLATAVAAG